MTDSPQRQDGYERALFVHSDQLVIHINRCHRYPSTTTARLALWLADRYYPKQGVARASWSQIAQAFGTSKRNAARWVEALTETGLWEISDKSKSRATGYKLTDEAYETFLEWLNFRKTSNRKVGMGATIIDPNAPATAYVLEED